MYVCIYFYWKWAFLVGEENSKELFLILVLGPLDLECFENFWKISQSMDLSKIRKEKRGRKTNYANVGCIAWEFRYPSEKHVPIIPGNHCLTDYISLFYLFITPRLQMCRRCMDLFPDIWGRKDWGWSHSDPHFSCLGADGWTRPRSIEPAPSVLQIQWWHLAEQGLNVEVAFQCFWTYKLR